MMAKRAKAKDTGGAAFPFMFTIAKGSNDLTGAIAQVEQRHVMTGMTLRDYFAAEALNSVYFDFGKDDEQAEIDDMARIAYAVADAMLAERVK